MFKLIFLNNASDFCNKNSGEPITVETELLDGEITSSDYANCGLSNVVFSGTATITDYNIAGGTDVRIPSTIDGFTVTTIGNSAFYHKGLTSVVIPNTVTAIDDQAFYGNQLTSVVIPSSVMIVVGERIYQSGNNTVSILGSFYNNQLTSVTIEGKSSSSDFTTYGTNIWGWASGYSDSDIVWTGSSS